jgi:hypothetical protein
MTALAAFAAVGGQALPVRSQTRPAIETPRQFAARLFTVYKPSGRWWRASTTAAGRREDDAYRQKVYADFYDPTLNSLLRRLDRASAKWADVFLDHDPVCQRQDVGRAYAVVSTRPRGAGLLDVHVRNPRDKTAWTLVVTPTASGWALFDVIDSAGSLRTQLAKWDTCVEHARTADQESHCV